MEKESAFFRTFRRFVHYAKNRSIFCPVARKIDRDFIGCVFLVYVYDGTSSIVWINKETKFRITIWKKSIWIYVWNVYLISIDQFLTCCERMSSLWRKKVKNKIKRIKYISLCSQYFRSLIYNLRVENIFEN